MNVDLRPLNALNSHVKKDLIDSFGFDLTNLIVVEAKKKAGASQAEVTERDYYSIIETISRDSRVKDKWGKAGVDLKLAKWRGILYASKWKDAPYSFSQNSKSF